MNLAGRTALVTGGARRIGRAIALRLADAGMDIALHYNRSEDHARQTAARIRAAGRRVTLIRADLADPDAPRYVIEQAVSAMDRLDVLVNNAAVFEPMALDAMEPLAWDRTLRVNLTAPAMLVRAAWPEFQRLGGGKVVNLCDASVRWGLGSYIAYAVSKAALEALTRILARQMAPLVQVNAVSPGLTEGPDDGSASSEDRARLVERIPLARCGSGDQIAAAVHFLLADGDYITGQVLVVDGGLSLR